MSEKIVFFDGVCNLCNEAVDRIISNDYKKQLKVAPLQGETATKYLNSYQIKNLDSLIFYEDGDIFEKSTAALRIARYLDYPWGALSLFVIVPAFLRDPLYSLIAKNRYRLFGKKETCRLPSESEKQRFLP